MEQTLLKNNSNNTLILFLAVLLGCCIAYTPFIFDQYTTSGQKNSTLMEEKSALSEKIVTLKEEKSSYDTEDSATRTKIIQSIPATYRQGSMLELLEELKKSTNSTIGQIHFDSTRGSNTMKAKDISLTLQVATTEQLIQLFEFIEKNPILLDIKNFSLQKGAAFAQMDITLTTYFDK